MTYIRFAASAICLFVCVHISIAQENEQPEISAEFLIQTVIDLSSPAYAGRLPGSEGYNAAASYCKYVFSNNGIEPVPGHDYYQYFKTEYNQILSPLKLQYINRREIIDLQWGRDFVCRGFTGSGQYKAELVFCGYGISLPEIGYDDYRGVDVEDKVVLIFKENPSWQIRGHVWPPAYPRHKAAVAALHGARGVLLVSSPKARDTKPIGSIATGDNNEHIDHVTNIHIDLDVANRMLALSRFNVESLQSLIDSTKRPYNISLDVEVITEVHTHYQQEAETMNVIAMIEGSDPVLKDEYLIIGAHLDHVGSQGENYFPGANDNASGCAAVLHLAALFKENSEHLKRSVVFILFGNEEQGLKGAKHYVDNPVVPLEQTLAMFNLDCVGHGDSIRVGNGLSAPRLWQLAKNTDRANDNMMVERTWGGGGADATPFHEAGIPALYFVATNSYTHLHLPSDTPETLNIQLFEQITRLTYATAWEILTGSYQKEKIINP